MSEEKTLTIKVIKDENTQEDREVTMRSWRLNYEDKRSLRRSAFMMKFMEIDLADSVTKVSPEELDKMTPEEKNALKKAKMKNIDMTGYSEAKEDAEDRIVQIVWGIKDIPLNQISGDDFDKMKEACKEANLFNFLALPNL